MQKMAIPLDLEWPDSENYYLFFWGDEFDEFLKMTSLINFLLNKWGLPLNIHIPSVTG